MGKVGFTIKLYTNFNTFGCKITILTVEKYPREKNAQADPYPDGIFSLSLT